MFPAKRVAAIVAGGGVVVGILLTLLGAALTPLGSSVSTVAAGPLALPPLVWPADVIGFGEPPVSVFTVSNEGFAANTVKHSDWASV